MNAYIDAGLQFLMGLALAWVIYRVISAVCGLLEDKANKEAALARLANAQADDIEEDNARRWPSVKVG